MKTPTISVKALTSFPYGGRTVRAGERCDMTVPDATRYALARRVSLTKPVSSKRAADPQPPTPAPAAAPEPEPPIDEPNTDGSPSTRRTRGRRRRMYERKDLVAEQP